MPQWPAPCPVLNGHACKHRLHHLLAGLDLRTAVDSPSNRASPESAHVACMQCDASGQLGLNWSYW